eukprot:m.200637 g.200637  ORF g.200637 m.200637 type:complete len:113 (-) comp16857_c1_seq4:1804-2142(-)
MMALRSALFCSNASSRVGTRKSRVISVHTSKWYQPSTNHQELKEDGYMATRVCSTSNSDALTAETHCWGGEGSWIWSAAISLLLQGIAKRLPKGNNIRWFRGISCLLHFLLC